MNAGRDMMLLSEELFPICRSITGDGLRRSLEIVARHIPLTMHEVPSGTKAYDWTVPPEWNIRGASIETMDGRRVVEFADHNLHVVQYSRPVDRVVSADELQRHLHSLPDRPDWIPYRTSYYQEAWGFCLTQRRRDALDQDRYRVRIDAELKPGHLTYGELVLPGRRTDEVLISAHCCHPSLANDNLSGMAVATALALHLAKRPRERTWRFLFVPGTIGSIVWLSRNEAAAARVTHGLVLAGVGSPHDLLYKQSRRGDTDMDRIAAHVLRHAGEGRVVPFEPYGYDERQYCSPGFDLPVGCLSRGKWGSYPEYHTSADDLSFLRADRLEASLRAVLDMAEAIERGDERWRSLSPKGEPQLGPRGLYRDTERYDRMTLLWVLNLADGQHTLLEMAERAGVRFSAVAAAADALHEASLLENLRE